jgi:diaminohydroxyphosphoribosylaminopyrimidine deaminase / 5-amino-6-(5-phosphoribosylamino)uracil reductase
LSDESYIQLAIEIAKKGMGNVSPNPLVGCVIVKNGRIVGAGYHEKFGCSHAEVNAINSANESIEGSTLYVNLEPCSHTGKTPPCVDKIIESKIKRVVIGTLDMNPLVSGSGIKKLKKAGIDVKVGVLEKECINLNKFFFKYILKKIPYVTLKFAQTLDAHIADHSGGSKWITCIDSRRYVHDLRSKYDAVLVGAGTVLKDNPSLTVRLVDGRNPKRVVIDTNLSLKLNLSLFKKNTDKGLIVLTSEKSRQKQRKLKSLASLGIKVVFIKEELTGRLDLKNALKELGKLNIASLLVEGGSKIFTSFIKEYLFDDILVFMSPKILGCGIPSIGSLGIKNLRQAVKVKVDNVKLTGDDVLIQLIK